MNLGQLVEFSLAGYLLLLFFLWLLNKFDPHESSLLRPQFLLQKLLVLVVSYFSFQLLQLNEIHEPRELLGVAEQPRQQFPFICGLMLFQ